MGINDHFIEEFKSFFYRKSYILLLLIIPPVIFILYGVIYQNRAIHNLPVVIWDEDHSELSRELTFFLEASEGIRISEYVTNQRDIEKGMQNGLFHACIHFPSDMENDIKRHHVPKIGLYINTSNLVIGKLLYKHNMEILLTAIGGISLKKFRIEGMPEQKARALVRPIRMDIRNGYNATFNYQQYLVPGLCTVALQMILIMAAALGLNWTNEVPKPTQMPWSKISFAINMSEAKSSRKKTITQDSEVNPTFKFLGKGLAFLTIATFWTLVFLYVISPIFGIAHQGHFADYMILFTLFNVACISIGFLLSAFLSDQMLASDFALFYTSPAFVFSGFTFPIWAMPAYDQFYAQILPYTPFLNGFIKTYFMGNSIEYLKPDLIHLSIFIGIALPLAFWRYHANYKVRHA